MPATDTPTATTGPTDADIQIAFSWLQKHVEHETRRRPTLSDPAHDGAISGLLWAKDHWHPEAGAWLPFARKAIRVATSRAISRTTAKYARRGTHLSLSAEDGDGSPYERADSALLARPDPSALSLAVEELAPELRQTIVLYFTHGYKLREVAALTGVPFSTARNRLLEAARLLGDGRLPVRRPVGARRVKN